MMSNEPIEKKEKPKQAAPEGKGKEKKGGK